MNKKELLYAENAPIRDWPLDDRPREKLLKYGESSLSDSELLALLVRTGRRGESALALARKIIVHFTTFRKMSEASVEEWLQIKGVGVAKVAQIKASFEIGKRFRKNYVEKTRIKITSAKCIVDILMPGMRDKRKEQFTVVFLDAQHSVILIEAVEEGTVDRAYPIMREIFSRAIALAAVSIICVHNHPSGNPEPSQADRLFTNDLKQAGAVLQVSVLDHIIIGNDVYFSFLDADQM